MRAFIFATVREAAPFIIKAGSVPPVSDNNTDSFVVPLDSRHDSVVLICGMGPASVRSGMKDFFTKHKIGSAVNAGIAGALNHRFKLGELLRIKKCASPEFKLEFDCGEIAGAKLPDARLVTVPEPVFDEHRRWELSKIADLVDMEGAVIAGECSKAGVPFSSLKCVSDMAGKKGRKSLLKNIDEFSEKIAVFLNDHYFK